MTNRHADILKLRHAEFISASSTQTNAKICGFTLAEVLITLGIIGIVAAMTIPTLMANYQKTQYVTQLKKNYSQMNQVLQQMAVDNGTVGDISSFFTSVTTAGDAISSYYKVSKNCQTNTGQGCVAKFNDSFDGSSGTIHDWDNTGSYYKFTTVDGTSFTLVSYDNSCAQNRGFSAAPDSPTYNGTCGAIYFDINGAKNPNMYGRDVFLFFITSKKSPLLYPAGGFYASTANAGTTTDGGSDYWNYRGTANACSSTLKAGYYCTGRVMDNSWTMDY